MLEDSTTQSMRQRDTRARDLALLDLGFNETKTDDTLPSPGGALEQAGESIGPYRLISLLGSGGFGNVWLAEQTEPIHRRVALKLIKPGMDSREIIARFEAERQTLALMDHPNIARVLDAGTSAAGRPYFALELVEGKPITTHCDELQIGIRERLELFITVCQAVQHAHQKAILHRDLKPSNILVAQVDGKMMPKVIDFGIAKALGANAEDVLKSSALATQAGIVVGTPNYMSPEQAGSESDVDTRSDIYSLGVILYELLTGTTPLAVEGQRIPFDEALRAVREREAVRPSMCVAKTASDLAAHVATRRKTDASRLVRHLRGDLDWVTMKAIEKDRQRRYETATALALDLQAYLDGRTVTAAAPTWTYRLGKFARRNSPALIAASLVAAALIIGTAMSLWQAREAERSRKDAERSRAAAETDFEHARYAVELFLSRITNERRLKDAEFSDLKLAWLMEAIRFYDKVSSRAGNDPKIRLDRAWTFGRLAMLYNQIGEVSKAVDAFRQAVEIHESLVAEFPQDMTHRRQLVKGTNNLAVVLDTQGDRAASEIVRKRALEVAEKSYADYPSDRDLRSDLVSVLFSYARALTNRNRLEEAEAIFRRAAQIQEGLVAQFNERDQRQELAVVRDAIAEIAESRDEHQKADILYREAVDLREKLAQEAPGNPKFREDLANLLTKRGLFLCRTGNADGLADVERAKELFEKLAQEFPKQTDSRLNAITVRIDVGRALKSLKRTQDAIAAFEEAIVLREKLASEFPGESKLRVPISILREFADLRRDAKQWAEARKLLKQALERQKQAFFHEPGKEGKLLDELYQRLVDTNVELKDYSAAFATAREAANLFPDDWKPSYRAALMAARCLRAIEQGAPVDRSREQIVTEEFSAAMIAMLDNAVAKGYEGVAQFCKQEGLPWLAERSDFQALLKEVPGNGLNREDLSLALEKSPAKFSYNYKSGDPGVRTWVRTGKIWVETQPSGKQNTFTVSAAIKVKDVTGTQITRTDGRMKLFVPQRNTEPMNLLIQDVSGTWLILGAMEDVE